MYELPVARFNPEIEASMKRQLHREPNNADRQVLAEMLDAQYEAQWLLKGPKLPIDAEEWFAIADAPIPRRPLMRWDEPRALGAVIQQWRMTSPIFALFDVTGVAMDKLIGYVRFGEFKASPLGRLVMPESVSAEEMGLEVPGS